MCIGVCVYVCVCVCLSVCLSVCVSFTTLTATYLVFFAKIQVLLIGFRAVFNVCTVWILLITLCQLSVDKRDNDGFFSSRLVCRTSDNSYNLTDSSLVTVDLQQSGYIITCNRTNSIFVVTPDVQS